MLVDALAASLRALSLAHQPLELVEVEGIDRLRHLVQVGEGRAAKVTDQAARNTHRIPSQEGPAALGRLIAQGAVASGLAHEQTFLDEAIGDGQDGLIVDTRAERDADLLGD